MSSAQLSRRSVKLALCCILLFADAIPAVSQTREMPLQSFLPQTTDPKGWKQSDSAKEYTGEDLFTLIDGGAVLFFEYGFDKVLAATYASSSGSLINLEIYRMKDAAAAYGIYSVRSGDRGRAVPIGQEGSRHPDYTMFWKGDYYVSVAGSDASNDCAKGMEVIAVVVAKALPDTGTKPSLLELLPHDELLKTWYARGTLGLSTFLPLMAEEMSGFSAVAAGKYKDRMLLVLQYPSPERSEHAAQRIQKRMNNGKGFSNYRWDGTIAQANEPDARVFCVSTTGMTVIVGISADESTAVNSVKALRQLKKFP